MIFHTTHQKKNEAGNALFLILIAVVLFAALSYAITQSNRSSGNAATETNLISSSTITQYPSAIRTGMTRMLLRGETGSTITFNPPSGFVGTTTEVFHPSGGGVVYQNVDPNTINGAPIAVGTHATSNWYFQTATVPNIGTSATDIVAVLYNIKQGICEQIDQQILGTTTIPALGIADSVVQAAGATYGAGVTGQPFVCAKTTDNTYVYYHVLLEQ